MSEAPTYPSYAEIVARRRAERREVLLRAARAAEAAAKERGFSLVVFGSLAAGHVHEGSDLDVALDGPAGDLFATDLAVWDAALHHGVEADVVFLPSAPEGLRLRILRDGRAPGSLG